MLILKSTKKKKRKKPASLIARELFTNPIYRPHRIEKTYREKKEKQYVDLELAYNYHETEAKY